MASSGEPDGTIPYERAAFSAHVEVDAHLDVVLCAPAEADTELVNAERLKGRLAVARRLSREGGARRTGWSSGPGDCQQR